MKANTVQKATLAIAAVVLAIAVLGYMATASPVAAQSANTSSSTSAAGPNGRMQAPNWGAGSRQNFRGPVTQGPARGGYPMVQNQVNISVGQTFTVTSTKGTYYVAGSRSTNGTASGTVTFTVTGKLTGGYTLSVSSGSVTVAGTTYTISSGTAQMNRAANGITGQGATTPAGQFLLRATAMGSFVGSTGTVSLDLQSGTSEYLVFLTGNITS